MVALFHPSQLEKRFGGKAEQPPYFWPPFMPSLEFYEDSETQMSVSDRQNMEQENQELRKIPSSLMGEEDSYEDNMDVDEKLNVHDHVHTQQSQVKNSIVKKELGEIH